MSGRTGNKRPSLTRAETIESCNSDDLVTVLEVHDRKPYKIMDRSRQIKKGVMAESLDELIERGKEKLNYPLDKEVYVVLEEDGTEVDEEEYFQTLPENTLLMLLHVGDKWSPFGPPFTPSSKSKSKSKSKSSADVPDGNPPSDEPDSGLPGTSGASGASGTSSSELPYLLERLERDSGFMALLSGAQLELLAEMDVAAANKAFKGQYKEAFLEDLQKAADRHLLEKNEIRDAVGLLKLYHQAASSAAPAKAKKAAGPTPSEAGTSSTSSTSSSSKMKVQASPRKKRRDNSSSK